MNEQENSEREDLEKLQKGKHVATVLEKARKKYFFLFTKRGLQYISIFAFLVFAGKREGVG
jgi:hypothetical protein